MNAMPAVPDRRSPLAARLVAVPSSDRWHETPTPLLGGLAVIERRELILPFMESVEEPFFELGGAGAEAFGDLFQLFCVVGDSHHRSTPATQAD